MRTLAIVLLAALAGCASTTSVSVGGAAAPGTSVSGASVGVHIESGSAAGALLGLAIIGGTVYGAGDAGMAAGSDRRVPELDPSRAVRVQDCSQPIQDWSANLKCK